jgi:hypothetical protein
MIYVFLLMMCTDSSLTTCTPVQSFMHEDRRTAFSMCDAAGRAMARADTNDAHRDYVYTCRRG